ncbi:MAG: alpha/beta fold hydrolase [candidate division KSB1 bacterium]|nr:alpha/beta fold hydrolase [candidate division KSB1 bacterium]MDZ7342785.1 alpha/beta fold hydrolase [candidate division KSB1 bacterium]
MKIVSKCLCFGWGMITFLVLATNSAAVLNRMDDPSIVGIWQGKLVVPGGELRIVFHFTQQGDTLQSTLDSPDQGAFGIPVSTVYFKNDTLWLESKAVRGIFSGKLQPDRSQINGQWQQSGMSFPLVLKKTEQAPQLKRPQEPKGPFPYLEQEVSYRNESAGIMLSGTLTLPKNGAPHPAVLLITGSGPQDRDEMVFGHRPFLILADYLTRQGIAVLRVDDRGVGKSTGTFATATSQDFAEDVMAGINYLKSRSDINPKFIGLIGHSEGGMIAPMVAARSADVAFMVLLAGTGLTGEQILTLQAALIMKANGASEAIIQKNRHIQKQIFDVLKTEPNDSLAAKQIRQIMQTAMSAMTDEEKLSLGLSEATLELQVKQVITPWFRFFLTYDPTTALRKVTCPVLAINGELDLQVPPKENLAAIASALKAGHNPHVTVKELPRLNHLFQTTTTGSPAEYLKIEETMSPLALQTIGDWILAQVQRK